ncbi:hypothetical protein PFISCL1PPCAC_28696, partial [Pristionchus fissidentatus]
YRLCYNGSKKFLLEMLENLLSYAVYFTSIFMPINIIYHMRTVMVMLHNKSNQHFGKALRFFLLHTSILLVVVNSIDLVIFWNIYVGRNHHYYTHLVRAIAMYQRHSR